MGRKRQMMVSAQVHADILTSTGAITIGELNFAIDDFCEGWRKADASFIDVACDVLADKIFVSPDIVYLFRKVMEDLINEED